MRTINSGWLFAKGVQPDSAAFTPVCIPHTWNTDAYTDKKYYRGTAWYQKTLTLSEQWKDKQIFLRFEAVSQVADIYINGQLAGQHKGGYTAFTIDITPFCSFSIPNLLTIRVDNAQDNVPPISGDFTFFGGIYRDIWLITVPKQHFCLNNNGSDGIFISTPHVSESEGTLFIKGSLRNDATTQTELEIINTLYAPDGSIIQRLHRTVKIAPGEDYTFKESPKPVSNPQLWSPETPHLYRVETTLLNRKNRQQLDCVSHHIGFRWYHFDGENGFSLNGKPYKLNGICRHQDQKPFGVALSDEMHRRDILLMKEMGVNFIRISHYPQDPAILEQCDKQGILAWEEIPIIDIVPESEEYANTCEQNLREMIRQHYNHPAIITWGYMNEILLTTPAVDKPEWPACKERTVALAQRLETVLKEEDPSRVSVMAFNMTNLYNEIGLNLEDVVGWNLYHGWYVGELKDFNAWCEDQHRRYPNQPIIISEWGAGSDKRLHTTNGRAFDFSIEYQQTYIEHYLPFIEETEWISGCAYWNFIDFNVAARQESMPRVNNKGVAYNNRTLKDVAYYFKALWRKDVPILRIASQDWDTRVGETNKSQAIKIYSNMPEVELFVNGQSVGSQKIFNCHTIFNVLLPKGESTILVQGVNDGKTVQDAMKICFQPFPNIAAGDELAINVGSNCFYTSDISSLTWLPDQPYTSGNWGYIDGEEHSTTSEIHNTVDGPLYQTWREGNFAYKIDAPQGDYEIELLMADVTKPATQLANLLGKSSGEKHSGETYFNISICGKQVETNFSPVDYGHYRTAFKRRYIVQNNDNCITINLNTIKGKAFLSGIKVRRL